MELNTQMHNILIMMGKKIEHIRKNKINLRILFKRHRFPSCRGFFETVIVGTLFLMLISHIAS